MRRRLRRPPVRRSHSADVNALLAAMLEAWHVTPREYVLSAIDSGRLSPGIAMNFLSTYFYLTHGMRVLDLTWQARAQFSPHWGIYEIGVLSPMLRVFFPQNQLLASMSRQLKSAQDIRLFPHGLGGRLYRLRRRRGRDLHFDLGICRWLELALEPGIPRWRCRHCC